MATFLQSKDVLELGKRIVDDLGLDQSVDTLGRWMAHYVAGLINDVETTTADTRSSKLKECKAAILDLWKHRNALPEGKRPFQDFEAILRALETLDPTDNVPRYFGLPRRDADKSEKDSKSQRWLKDADAIDRAAKMLIGYCLARAAQGALDKSKDWVTLAEAAGADDGVDLLAIRFVSKEANLTDTSKLLAAKERKLIESRIKYLEEFRKAAADLTADLNRQLKNAGKGQSKLEKNAKKSGSKKRTKLRKIKKIKKKKNH